MLDYEFMRLAFAAGAIVGLLAPVVGFFLVQRQLSLIGDGIGHVAFAGVAAGYLLGVSPTWTALVAAVAGAAGIEWLRAHRRAAGDPELLVLDEPTAGVDVDAQESPAALLEELHRDLDVTILFVSHEFGAVEHFVHRIVLVRERIVFDGPPAELPGVWHDPSHVHDHA